MLVCLSLFFFSCASIACAFSSVGVGVSASVSVYSFNMRLLIGDLIWLNVQETPFSMSERIII